MGAVKLNEKATQLAGMSSAVSLTAQIEWDQRIAWLTDELARKSALLEQVKANATEGEDRLLAQTSLVKQRDAELADMQSKLRKHEDRLLAQTSLVKQKDVELVDMRSKLREHEDRLLAQTSLMKQRDVELVAIQSRLRNTDTKLDEPPLSHNQQIQRLRADLENVRAELEAKKSELEVVRKANARTFHTTTAASLIDLNEDRSMYGLKEDDLESLQCNE